MNGLQALEYITDDTYSYDPETYDYSISIIKKELKALESVKRHLKFVFKQNFKVVIYGPANENEFNLLKEIFENEN